MRLDKAYKVNLEAIARDITVEMRQFASQGQEKVDGPLQTG